MAEMRRSWSKVDFESVRNQSALVCNCRHEDLVQLLEVEFTALLETLQKSQEPVHEVMAWADKCCDTFMASGRTSHAAPEENRTMNSRSVLIRWGYVTSQVMRDLVGILSIQSSCFSGSYINEDYPKRPRIWRIPDFETFLRVGFLHSPIIPVY